LPPENNLTPNPSSGFLRPNRIFKGLQALFVFLQPPVLFISRIDAPLSTPLLIDLFLHLKFRTPKLFNKCKSVFFDQFQKFNITLLLSFCNFHITDLAFENQVDHITIYCPAWDSSL